MIDDHLFLGGGVRTEIQKREDNISFAPELSAYTFTAGFRTGNLETGFLWTCEHPTTPFYSSWSPIINWEGYYCEVYLKLSGEVPVIK